MWYVTNTQIITTRSAKGSHQKKIVTNCGKSPQGGVGQRRNQINLHFKSKKYQRERLFHTTFLTAKQAYTN